MPVLRHSMPQRLIPILYVVYAFVTLACAGVSRSKKSADQIAAEQKLLGQKTALLERENQVLRDENLEITRAGDLARADYEKKQREFTAMDEKRLAEIKTVEASIANLKDKIAILESESGGKIRQLTALNTELADKSQKAQEKLQEDLKRLQLASAQEKEKLQKEAAEKQFNQAKELQETKQRLANQEKDADELRKKISDLRENEARLTRENTELKNRLNAAPIAPPAAK